VGWDLYVVDVAGRLVRQLVRASQSQPGIQMISWDGRYESGVVASQGVYYAVARGGGRKETRSLVLIR
jgi:hypothetical protein